jgi:hypothetical protein
MGFSGGGGGVLTNHTHDTAITNDGGELAAGGTMFGLSNGSILYSDGVNIQELVLGSDTQVLSVSGSAPTWITNTANPLIKVTKTYADIVVGTTSMPIYTLPEDSALVNIWADITTVFDISTAVTIGDAGDDNGFQEATDWVSGTGLTDATRGAYVTSFKTMRSTSGTTDINAYNFSTTTSGGSTFTQSSTNNTRTIQTSGRQELAQQFTAGHVLIDEEIRSASFFMNVDSGSPAGTIRAFMRQADGTLVQQSSDTLDASTVTGSSVEYTFNFPSTTLLEDYMLTISGADMSTGSIACSTNLTEMSDGKLYQTNSTGSSYTQLVANMMKMNVAYGTVTTASDTQGEIDFYLQVVD